MITKETFENTVKKVMEHNDYKPSWTTATACDAEKKWSPCDLIAREYLNNGGGSAQGFLGIGTQVCINAYKYMCAHKQELIEQDLISKKAWNNWGFPLWNDYNFDC